MEIVFTPYSVKRYCQKLSDSVKETNPSNTVIIHDLIRNTSLCFVPSDIEVMNVDTERMLKDIDAFIPKIRSLVVEDRYNTLVVSRIYSRNPDENGEYVRSRYVYPISRNNFIEGIFGNQLTSNDATDEDRVGEEEEKTTSGEISIYISRVEYEDARVPLREIEVKGLDREKVYRISSMRHSILVDSSFEKVAPDTARVRLVHRKDAELENPTGYIDGSKTRRTPIYSVEGHSPREEMGNDVFSSLYLKHYFEEDDVVAIKYLYSTVNHYLMIRLAIRKNAINCLKYLVQNGTDDERLDAVVFLYLLEGVYNITDDNIKDLLFKNTNIEMLVFLGDSFTRFTKHTIMSVEGNENWNPENSQDNDDENYVIEGFATIPKERRIDRKTFRKIRKQIDTDYKAFLERTKFINPTQTSAHSIYTRDFNRAFNNQELSNDGERDSVFKTILKKYDDERSKEDFLSGQSREVLENIASFVGTSGSMRSASRQLSRQRDIFHQPPIFYRTYDEEGRLVNPTSVSESFRRELRYVPTDNEGRYVARDTTALIRRDIVHPNLQDWMNNSNRYYTNEEIYQEIVKEMSYIDFSKSPLPNDTLIIESDSLYFIEMLFLLRNTGKLPVIKRLRGGFIVTRDSKRKRRLLTNPEFIRWLPSGKIQSRILSEIIKLKGNNIDLINLCLNTFSITEIQSSSAVYEAILYTNDVSILRVLLDRGLESDDAWDFFKYRMNDSKNMGITSADLEIARELLRHNIVPTNGRGLSGKIVIILKKAGISDRDLHQYIRNATIYIMNRYTFFDDEQNIGRFNNMVQRIVNFMNEMYIGGVLGIYFDIADLSIETLRRALYHFSIDRLLVSLIPDEQNYSINALYETKPENAKIILTVILGQLNRERNVEGESETVRRIVEFLVEVRNEARSRHQVWIIDMINNALSPSELSPRSTRYLEGAGRPIFVPSPERDARTIGRSSPELKMPEEKDMREWRGGLSDEITSLLYQRSPVLPYAGPEYREEDYNPEVIASERRRMLEDRLDRLGDEPYWNPDDDE